MRDCLVSESYSCSESWKLAKPCLSGVFSYFEENLPQTEQEDNKVPFPHHTIGHAGSSHSTQIASCMQYVVQCLGCSVQCRVCSDVFSVQCVLYSVHYNLPGVVCSVQCAVRS